MIVAQLCPILLPPRGLQPARLLCPWNSQEWVAIPFYRGSSQPRDQTQVSCTAGRFHCICKAVLRYSDTTWVMICPCIDLYWLLYRRLTSRGFLKRLTCLMLHLIIQSINWGLIYSVPTYVSKFPFHYQLYDQHKEWFSLTHPGVVQITNSKKFKCMDAFMCSF